MTNLITEARELCEDVTPGQWKRHDTADYAEIHNGDTWGKDLSPIALVGHTDDANFIARSRTLIPELCDALEKAEKQNKQLVREVSALAAESVKRDVTLARLEAEVEGALLEKAERSRANSFSVQTDMFGEYCLVPTGCDKEKHIYKVVTRFRSNSYCGVPLVYDSKPVLHDGVVDVLNVIHCGIDETKVERVALSDVELCGKRLEEHHEAD